MSHNEPDESLIERYYAGHASSFEILYLRHKQSLFNYFFRQVNSQHETAEDLCHSVWLRVIAAKSQFTPQAKFSTYLYTIAHNLLVDHYRALRHPTVSLDNDDAPIIDPALITHEANEERDEKKLARALLELIDKLPADQKEVFLLRRESDLSLKEIADCTGVGVETVKSKLRYAIGKLRDGLHARGLLAHE